MPQYKAKFLPSVHSAIGASRNWYRQVSPSLILRLNAEIASAIAAVLKNPAGYSIRFANVRRINLVNFPYAFFFTIIEDRGWVLFTTFFHVKRNLPFTEETNPENILNEP